MKKDHIAGIFTRAAPIYDQVAFKFFSYFGKRLVELMEIPPRVKVLDVAAGRGASLFPASEQIGPEGSVIGINISEGMVKETTNEIISRGFSNATMIQMDAENLIYPNNSFDIILCGFGIFFFPQCNKALRETWRVLKPNGQIGISTFYHIEDANSTRLRERINKAIRKYLPPPLKQEIQQKNKAPIFDTQEGMQRLLSSANFRKIRCIIEEKEFLCPNIEEYWNYMWSVFWRAQLEKIPSEKHDLLKDEITTIFNEFKREDGLHNTISVLFTFGKKYTFKRI
ncbi:MAG: class I SAM-dependent methyltransferase [Candidatus Hodarchaeota archaeon]